MKNAQKATSHSTDKPTKHSSKPLTITKICMLSCRYAYEFIRGLIYFRKTTPYVTVFGSARTSPAHTYYNMAYELGKGLAAAGMTVMTGAGPGLMEAVNKGTHEAGGTSLGCGIDIPGEQVNNPYLSRIFDCQHFFVRKFLLCYFAQGYIVLPGGFGTLDEVFEVITLIKTNRLPRTPIVLLDTTYWQPMLDYINDKLIEHNMVDQHDVDCLFLTNDINMAIAHIHDNQNN